MRHVKYGLLAVYVGAVVAANWMIQHVGMAIPGGTHLLPVGFGLMAPSGTYAAAVVLVSRDLVQRTSGRTASLVVIPVGVAITALFDWHLALASGTAFALSELADFAVYTPIAKRSLVGAVALSASVGNLVDSTVFLTLAGIPLAVAWPGLVVGKFWAILAATAVIAITRQAWPVPQAATA